MHSRVIVSDVVNLIKIDEIPESWSKDQIKIYEIYTEYIAGNKDNLDFSDEFEKLLARWLDESQIKIVSWNCNGKFREKFKEIISEDADIYVIQECENLQNQKTKITWNLQETTTYGQETCTIRDLEYLQKRA